jgi:hypothetical protein
MTEPAEEGNPTGKKEQTETENQTITLGNVFSTVFSGPLEGLVWKETSRQNPRQFYEEEDKEEYSEDFEEGIPEGIGDAFGYKLETPYFTVNFSQRYMPYHTLAVHQFLSFNFGKPSQSLAQMLDANPFAPENAQLRMEFGKYDESNVVDYIDLRQNNVYIMDRRDGDDIFTQSGSAMMQDLFSQKEKMCSIPGLSEADKALLETTLGILETHYKAGNISLVSWHN